MGIAIKERRGVPFKSWCYNEYYFPNAAAEKSSLVYKGFFYACAISTRTSDSAAFMTHTPNYNRLIRAFARQGLSLTREGSTWHARNENAQASILLPDSLPLEDKAVSQLLAFAAVAAPDGEKLVCKACATPDFHPGSIAPVGSIVATAPDVVIPASVGTDINCGMRLLTTGLTLGQLAPHKTRLVSRLKQVLLENERDIPVSTLAFRALFDDGPHSFIDHLNTGGIWHTADKTRLHSEVQRCIGLQSFTAKSQYAPQAYTQKRDVYRDPCLGTPGGGNHFVELQVVDEVFDKVAAYSQGIQKGSVVLMLHSGSRDLGFYVGTRWMDRARAQWPMGLKHPASNLYALQGDLASEYLSAMGVAARYAWANRVVLAEMVRKEIAALFGTDDSRLVVDVPHNVVLQENGFNIHRKGATPAHAGDLALIPGSMGTSSYLATGLGSEDWLWSCSHGAGRSVRRQEMRAFKPVVQDADAQTWQCVTLREERLIEEAPGAYKPIGDVIDIQERAGLIAPVAALKPWVTFKA